MTDFNLDSEDINNDSKEENNAQAENVRQTEFLAELDTHSIAKVFSNFNKEKRTLIIPIGFPQAGKSLLLASLMYYARKGEDTLFRTNLEIDFPYDKGRIAADEMIEYFSKGNIYGTSPANTMDLIGINIDPSKALKKLNLAFVDLAGEDLQNIKQTKGAKFTEKIEAMFNGLKVDNTPVIFVLITPFRPAKLDNESIEDAHIREDTLHYDFLNYIEMGQKHIQKNSTFFVIVSQWDVNPNQNQRVEDYIRDNRPSIYGYVKDKNVVWGEYSVGRLLETTREDGVKFQEIVRINKTYPSKFWKKLYEICTGKELDSKKWWQKLFG